MPLMLTEEDVGRLLPMREAIAAVRAGFEALAAGRASNVPRSRVRLPGVVLNVMSGALGAGPASPEGAAATGGYLGVKSYSVSREGARFLFLLYSATGALLAIMEADRLGQIRTGAASGLATLLMARPDARAAGIIGTGWQARSQLEAVAAVRPIRVARAFSRREEPRRAFAREMEAALGIEVIPVPDAASAVEGADVVITVTNAREPVLRGARLRPGMHVNAAGSNLAQHRELDEDAVARADLIATDSVEQARNEAGDLIAAANAGRIGWDRVTGLDEIVSGRRAGRGSASEVTLFKSNGIALEDVAVAAHVYERAIAAGAGRDLPFGPP